MERKLTFTLILLVLLSGAFAFHLYKDHGYRFPRFYKEDPFTRPAVLPTNAQDVPLTITASPSAVVTTAPASRSGNSLKVTKPSFTPVPSSAKMN